MQGVIKKLIIIHLGSMHEPIHPNRWINSERGDESAGGRNRRTPSVRLCGSGLRVPGKLQEARRRLWAPSPGPSLHPHHPRAEGAWWSLLIWEPLLVFEGGDRSAWVAWNPLLFQQTRSLKLTGSSIQSWVVKTFFLNPFSFSPTFIMISTTSVLFFPYQEEED